MPLVDKLQSILDKPLFVTLGKVGKFIGEAPRLFTRSGATAGLTFTEPFTKRDTIDPNDGGLFQQAFVKSIFGPERLEGLKTRSREAPGRLAEFGAPEEFTPERTEAVKQAFSRSKFLQATAPLGVAAVVGADLTGAGGSKKVVGKPSVIKGIAGAVGKAQKKLAPLMAKAAEFTKLDDFMRSLPKYFHQTTTGNAKTIESAGFTAKAGPRAATDITTPNGVFLKRTPEQIQVGGFTPDDVQLQVSVPDNLNILDIKNKVIELNTGRAEYDVNIVNFLTRKTKASVEKLYERFFDIEAGVILGDPLPKEATKLATKIKNIITKDLQTQGFDGVKFLDDVPDPLGIPSGEYVDTLLVFDPKNIKTQSQLTDIFNQSRKVDIQALDDAEVDLVVRELQKFRENPRAIEALDDIDSWLAKAEKGKLKKEKLADAYQFLVSEGAIKQSVPKLPAFKLKGDVTTKVLNKLEGRSSVSRQFIDDLSKGPELKQPERDLIRRILDEYPEGEIPVKEFGEKVQMELLPLESRGHLDAGKVRVPSMSQRQRYENIVLPDELRGNIANYNEIVYESPIKTSAGDIHFDGDRFPNYFAHTRIEDLADVKNYGAFTNKLTVKELPAGEGVISKRYGLFDDGKLIKTHSSKSALDNLTLANSEVKSITSTRRVIELQSDLFQKGRLEMSVIDRVKNPFQGEAFSLKLTNGDSLSFASEPLKGWQAIIFEKSGKQNVLGEGLNQTELFNLIEKHKNKIPTKEYDNIIRANDVAKLQPYRNTWHERVIREEIKQAAIDGKTKLQFPTGVTAMDIEGLGGRPRWRLKNTNDRFDLELTSERLKVGQEVGVEQPGFAPNDFAIEDSWIVTDVLGEGKFKAIEKKRIDEKFFDTTDNYALDSSLEGTFKKQSLNQLTKPERKRYLDLIKERYTETFDISGKIDTSNPIYKFYEKDVMKYLKRSRPDMKMVTDPQGVTWWEVPVKKADAKRPIEAFGALPFVGLEEQEESVFDRFRNSQSTEPLFISQ